MGATRAATVKQRALADNIRSFWITYLDYYYIIFVDI